MALPTPATTDDIITIGSALETNIVDMKNTLSKSLDQQVKQLQMQNSLTAELVKNTKPQDKFAAKESRLEAARMGPGGETLGSMSFDDFSDALAKAGIGGGKVEEAPQETESSLGGKITAGIAAVLGGGALTLFKKTFETGGWLSQAKSFFDDTEKDAGLAEGRKQDADRVTAAEDLIKQIAEAEKAGNEEKTKALKAQLDEQIKLQEEALAKTEDTAGFFRDQAERDAVNSSKATLERLQQLKGGLEGDGPTAAEEKRNAQKRAMSTTGDEMRKSQQKRQEGESEADYAARMQISQSKLMGTKLPKKYQDYKFSTGPMAGGDAKKEEAKPAAAPAKPAAEPKEAAVTITKDRTTRELGADKGQSDKKKRREEIKQLQLDQGLTRTEAIKAYDAQKKETAAAPAKPAPTGGSAQPKSEAGAGKKQDIKAPFYKDPDSGLVAFDYDFLDPAEGVISKKGVRATVKDAEKALAKYEKEFEDAMAEEREYQMQMAAEIAAMSDEQRKKRREELADQARQAGQKLRFSPNDESAKRKLAMAREESAAIDAYENPAVAGGGGGAQRGGAVQQMSEENAGAQQPVVINNVKQGDTVNSTNVSGSKSSPKNARPNAGSTQVQ